jgi:glycosyltransferase involved in cell wall biosynthesis
MLFVIFCYLVTVLETFKFLFTSTFFPPNHLGGDAMHVQYLVNELAARGHEVHVLHSLDAYNLKRKHIHQQAKQEGIYTYGVKTVLNQTAYRTYLTGNSTAINRKFKQLLKDVNPDIVHHHNISLLGYGLLKKQKNYHNIYTAHDYWLICQKSDYTKNGAPCNNPNCVVCALKNKRTPQLWRQKTAYAQAIKDIDLLIAPSNYMKNQIDKKLKIKTVTFPNFAPSPAQNGGTSGFENFFIYAGMVEAYKGVMDLVTAFKTHAFKARLLIVGNGSLKPKITQIIRENHLYGRIVPMGWVEDDLLHRLLADANALVLPAKWPENSPLVTLEALAAGTPVIASKQGGLPEIVEKVDRHLLFEDIDELCGLLENFDKKTYPPAQLKQVYETNFSPSAYMGRYLEILKTLPA